MMDRKRNPLTNGGGAESHRARDDALASENARIAAAGQRVVLVVEDSEDLRRFLRRTLERYGFSVLEAGSAEEALMLADAASHGIDILLMDIMLPDSWGTRLAEDIRMLHPDVGVILTSGHTVEDPVLGAGITQRNPFLKKPFAIEQLLQAIADVSSPVAPLGPDEPAP
jgi:two-component system, cell cycle sensor histidine kinase and response regulator CckA